MTLSKITVAALIAAVVLVTGFVIAAIWGFVDGADGGKVVGTMLVLLTGTAISVELHDRYLKGKSDE